MTTSLLHTKKPYHSNYAVSISTTLLFKGEAIDGRRDGSPEAGASVTNGACAKRKRGKWYCTIALSNKSQKEVKKFFLITDPLTMNHDNKSAA